MKDDIPKYIFVKDVLLEHQGNRIHASSTCLCEQNMKNMLKKIKMLHEYTLDFGGNENFNRPITRFLQIDD